MNKGTKPKRYDGVFMSIVRMLQKNPIHSLAQYEQKGILQYLLFVTVNFHIWKLDCHKILRWENPFWYSLQKPIGEIYKNCKFKMSNGWHCNYITDKKLDQQMT